MFTGSSRFDEYSLSHTIVFDGTRTRTRKQAIEFKYRFSQTIRKNSDKALGDSWIEPRSVGSTVDF